MRQRLLVPLILAIPVILVVHYARSPTAAPEVTTGKPGIDRSTSPFHQREEAVADNSSRSGRNNKRVPAENASTLPSDWSCTMPATASAPSGSSTRPAPSTRPTGNQPEKPTTIDHVTLPEVLNQYAAPPEPKGTREAIQQFRERPGFRMGAARKLLPLLKPGMDRKQVEELLGPPTEQVQIEGGPVWSYVLMYSQFMDVYFNSSEKVVRVHSSVGQQPAEITASQPTP